jgi:putative sigma-54 modulation protein
MIERMEISGHHYEVDDKLRKYVLKRIAGLDKYIPKRLRQAAHAEVILRAESKGGKKYTAEVIMRLPSETITAKESTLNMYAAIDILESKLKNSLRRYKDLHSNPSVYRKLSARLRRSTAGDASL